MSVGYVDFEVEGGDIAPGARRNEFEVTLSKPLFLMKNVLIPKKRATDIRETFTK